MSFEQQIGQLNEHFFFREFTFSKTTFRPTPTEEVELADNVVWLDDLVVVFQLKERSVHDASTADDEERWFKRKVVGRGTRQIRDTLAYLGAHTLVDVENHRGHTFHLRVSKITTMHKIVCYLPHEKLPEQCRMHKSHRSQTAGLIHLMAADDYLGIVRTLLTPPELSEYLSFREELIDKWEGEIKLLPEPALVGQYLAGDADSPPSMAFIQYLSALEHNIDEWDMSGIIKQFPDRVTTDNQATDYYSIVTEIAKLKRNELREFKQRFQLSMQKCRANEFVRPYRMASPRTKCGFVFIPLQKAVVQHRLHGLKNLTYACKYDLKLHKCLGMSFAPEEGGWYSVEWCYMEFLWEYDEEVDERLRSDNPFREVRVTDLGRYTYRRQR
jgi:hypothetical protein